MDRLQGLSRVVWVGREGEEKMVASAMTRRGALAALGAFGLTLTGAVFSARAQSGLRFSAIVVNVAPLRPLTGEPTASWMEEALEQALPRALGPHLAPGDRNAAILEVRIDWIYLAPSPGGPGPRGSAQDTIVGSFLVRGPRGGIASVIPLRAIASYYPSAVDQTLVARAYHARIVTLGQTFAGWAPRELGL
jgi:hypothetical protein